MDDQARRVIQPVLDALDRYGRGEAHIAEVQGAAAGAAGALDNANRDLRVELERFDPMLERIRFTLLEEDQPAAVAAATEQFRRLTNEL